MKTIFSTLVIFLLTLHAFGQNTVHVNIGKRIKILNGFENGINLNYLMDGGFTNPATPTGTALKSMGMKLLRYPGGEKSDNYLWSAAPWTAASPRMALLDTANAWPTEDDRFVNKASAEKLCKPVVLDFDELMTLCNQAGAMPLIVVAYDAMFNTVTADKPTKQQLLTNAVEWVRYANVTKKFGIKYWMIGNESWNQPDYNGRTTAAQYATDLVDFATAMKAVDPTIKIIANGDNTWWQTLLQSPAVKLIDILAFSQYPVQNFTAGYESYRTNNASLINEINDAIKAINTYAPAADRARIKVLAAEYNSIDFDGGWNNENDLGHALLNFQLFGDMVVTPKVESACLWNTRWTDNTTDPQHLFDALDRNGNLNATGLAQQVWGTNLLHTIVEATSNNNFIKTYATHDTARKTTTIFLLNKDTQPKTVSLSIGGFAADYYALRYVFSGKSVLDKAPVFSWVDHLPDSARLDALSVPATSVTVLKLDNITNAPFQFQSFTGEVAASNAKLDWQTINDFRLQSYTVEKRTGGAFAAIGAVAVKAHEAPSALYSFLDTGFVSGTATDYRLKLTGINGQISYSDTVRFLATALPATPTQPLPGVQIQIAPNPAGAELWLQTRATIAQQATVEIVDAVGRVWASEKLRIATGTSTTRLRSLRAIPSGVYWLRVQIKKSQQTFSFLKK